MSVIALKKKKRMIFLPVEFNNVEIDALLDSGAYINDISERDDKKNQTQCQPVYHKQGTPSSFQSTLG